MKEILQLNNILAKRKFSQLARQRLGRDLAAVILRLEKNEYETSGMVQNAIDLAEQSRVFYSHLNTYAQIGRCWEKVFRQISVNKYDEVLDICPGYAPKVEIGLFYAGYQGKVIILDKDKKAITTLAKTMQLFQPSFKIEPYPRNLFSPLKKKFKIVVGNHILDDLIIAYYCGKNKVDSSDIYESEKNFIDLWNRILESDQEFIEGMVSEFSQIFKSLVSIDGFFCLAYYKSFMERMLSLDKSYYFTQELFYKIIQNMTQNDFIMIKMNKDFNSKVKPLVDYKVEVLKRIK